MTGSTGVQVRVQSWTDFNQPDTLSYRGKSVAFSYDAGYKRVKEITTDGATVRTLFLVHPDNVGGLGFEREETRVSGGVTRNESRHYISVGGSVIAVVKTLNDSGTVSTDVNLTNYWHKDGLGSIVAVTNVSGAVLERMAYDAWGRRQRDTGRVDPDLDPANGNRGFTGHEHLDELALIHMNGRVYDPFLGRFLSADPIIEAEHLLQSYNRYSYVLNNPLRYTDPSGHCIDFCISAMVMMAVAGTALMVEGNTYWRMVGAIMTAYAIGPGGLAEAGLAQAGIAASTAGASAIAGGYVGLVSSGGDLSAAIEGAVFAAAFATVGGSSLGTPAKVAAHALIGCLQGAASGGKCGPSAMAAAFGKIATINIPPGFDALGAVVTAIAGGTASVIGGGKFANGALQAGFGYIFNCLSTPGPCTKSDQPEIRRAAAACGGDIPCLQRVAVYARESGIRLPPDIGQTISDFLKVGIAGGAALAVAAAPAAESFAAMTTHQLKQVMGKEGSLALRELFGSGVEGATAALRKPTWPQGLTADALMAYRELATRNAGQLVQQIRVQVIDKLRGF